MLLCLAVGIVIFTGCTVEVVPVEPEQPKIALLPISLSELNWSMLEEGAMEAAAEIGIEMISLSPDVEENEQVSDRINAAVVDGCQVVIIASVGSEEVSEALQATADSGVKVVCVDSAAAIESTAVIATDQKAAGRAAAEAMLQVLEARRIREGQIGIIGVNAGDSAAAQREAGFREVFAGSAYALLETQYGEGDPDKSKSVAEAFLDQNVIGLFGCDVDGLLGAGKAGRETGARPVVTGVGDSEEVRNLLEDGSIRAAVTSNWDVMGYEAVKAAAAALEGVVQESVTDTGVTVLQSEAPVTVNCDYKIALITEERIAPYWIALEDGAMKASSELGCEVMNLSPSLKDEAQQIQYIEEAVASGFHAIVIAANGSDEMATALQEAAAAGVKVVCINTSAGMEAAATIFTDNHAAGRTSGEALIAALEEREITEGSVGIIGINPDSELFAQREAGFREAFEGKAYTLLETQYSEGDAAKSHAIAENYLNEDTVGIFCVGKGCTIGAGNAVGEENADALVVGFETSDVILEMIEEGWLFAAIAQNPDAMGYEAVKAACAALNGENPDGTVINVGVSVLTQS